MLEEQEGLSVYTHSRSSPADPGRSKARPQGSSHRILSETERIPPEALPFLECLCAEVRRQEEGPSPQRLPSLGGVSFTSHHHPRALCPARGSPRVSSLLLAEGSAVLTT